MVALLALRWPKCALRCCLPACLFVLVVQARFPLAAHVSITCSYANPLTPAPFAARASNFQDAKKAPGGARGGASPRPEEGVPGQMTFAARRQSVLVRTLHGIPC